MSIKQITKLRYKTKDKPPMEGVPLLGYNKRYDCPWTVVYRSKDKYYTCMKYDTEFETYPPNPKFPTKSDLVIEKPWLNEVSAATLQQK